MENFVTSLVFLMLVVGVFFIAVGLGYWMESDSCKKYKISYRFFSIFWILFGFLIIIRNLSAYINYLN